VRIFIPNTPNPKYVGWDELHKALTSQEETEIDENFSLQTEHMENESDQIHIRYKRGKLIHTFVIKAVHVDLFYEILLYFQNVVTKIPTEILQRNTTTIGHQTEIKEKACRYIFFARLEQLKCNQCKKDLVSDTICVRHPRFPGFCCWDCRWKLQIDYYIWECVMVSDVMLNPEPLGVAYHDTK
jgi:hypothetical protein